MKSIPFQLRNSSSRSLLLVLVIGVLSASILQGCGASGSAAAPSAADQAKAAERYQHKPGAPDPFLKPKTGEADDAK